MTQLDEHAVDVYRSAQHVPASSAQKRMWLVSQNERETTSQNVLVPIRLRGTLDRMALATALAQVLHRQQALRTTFAMIDGRLVQQVRPSGPVPLPVVDLSDAGDEQDTRVHELFVAAESEPFDLASGPVLRAQLLQLAEQDHVLLLCVHHIAIDAQSVPVFYRELAAAYNAETEGAPNPLPQPEMSYADYAQWQHNLLTGAVRTEQLDFWRAALAGVGHLDLPTDRPVPAESSGVAGFTELPLDPAVLARLAELADTEQADRIDGLHAVLNLLLSRYSGAEDIVVGTTTTQREHPDLAEVIGYFPNTLVLRTDLSGQPSFRTVLRRTAEVNRAALAHAALPFDVLVQELAPNRVANRPPFFRVYFGHDQDTDEMPEFTGLVADGMLPDFSQARFDLSVKIVTSGEDATLYLAFSRDLYDDATIVRMLGHFETLLANAVATPDIPARELAMLTERELHDVLVTWNDTEGPFPDTTCLHQLFESAVDRDPSATAAICGTDSVTYGELDQRANQLAHRLRALGVGPEVLVGICLRRSIQHAVAVLAVLKAGGGYLPLDPEYPPDRLTYMVGDAGVWGVLTESSLRESFDESTRLVALDEEDLGVEPVTRPVPQAGPDNIAYVIYTSGSTGKPKGIVLRHQGAVNNFHDINTRYGVGPGDKLFAISSPSFDMSVYDLLGTLGAGATVVMPHGGETKQPARWAELILDHGVTVWHSVPALLELTLEHLSRQENNQLPALRLAFLSGDWIPLTLPARIWAAAPQAKVTAQGGSTEASMDSVVYPVEEIDPRWVSIPYGRPMANQRAYVLDANMLPQPVGVPGELHLAGVGLARGYLNRPRLTGERFVTHTWPDGRVERLYKTGDLARYFPDGAIELLGRMDFQVKVHGLRIELGELEAALTRHDAVAEAVVVARGERGDLSLAGFVRLAEGSDEDEATLRDWMAKTLPSHMVPATVTVVEQFPITPNGKVDRTALSAVVLPASSSSAEPADEVERRVAEIWQDLLGVERIGLDDDFFKFGGDSFTAVRAMLALEISIPVVEMFKTPTVRGIAKRIRAAEAGGGPRLLNELKPATDATEFSLVCVPYGGGNAIGYQPLAEQLSDRFALWAVTLPGHELTSIDEQQLTFAESVRQVAAEVRERISGAVIVYGHCIGTHFAAALARKLLDDGVDVRVVYLGASLPEEDPAASLAAEQVTTDEQWAAYLTSIGGFDGALDWSTVEHIMAAGRVDHRGAQNFLLESYANPPAPIEVPVHLVYGDADPGTEGFAEKHTRWAVFAKNMDLTVIHGGNHYFVRNNAAELAALIDRQNPGDRPA